MKTPFQNRRAAGRVLAEALSEQFPEGLAATAVFALPRGGVPVAYEVALRGGFPLDVLTVRKLGFPGHEEWAAGAIAAGGIQVLNPDAAAALAERLQEFAVIVQRETAELARRERRYRGDLPPRDIHGRGALLVDDGIATGTSLRAGIAALRARGAARVIVAAPVGDSGVCAALRQLADEVVCPVTPADFRAVGRFYGDFTAPSDDEVVSLIAAAHAHRGS